VSSIELPHELRIGERGKPDTVKRGKRSNGSCNLQKKKKEIAGCRSEFLVGTKRDDNY